MNTEDYNLAESPVGLTIRGPLNISNLTSTFTSVLVQHNPIQKVTRLTSLVTVNNTSNTLPCPRDDLNSYVILNDLLLQQDNCCNYCINQIDCYVNGYTKQFILSSRV